MTPGNSRLSMADGEERQPWLNYRTVWRWHFYAGLFCIPFVIWLSITGSIYLFKPQIERWLDRPYDHLTVRGPRATPEAQALAALAAVPQSSLHYYELPRTEDSATRVIVGKGTEEYRVYVHPQTLQILKVVSEDKRPMRIVFRLHGELMAGDWGSRIVELAASWAIVMIVSGLYLWWPRQSERLAGVLYVRWKAGRRILWRDLHAVTGVWVSAFALFLLFTGLPWAKGWGGYLKAVRSASGSSVIRQEWTTGRSSEIENRVAMNAASMAGRSMEHSGHMSHAMSAPAQPNAYAALDRLVPAVEALRLANPVLIMPPMPPSKQWSAKSDSQNRPLRTVVTLEPSTGAVTQRENFRQRPWLDRVIGIGVAAHEGQLFGILNQLLGLFTAIGLILLCVSATVLWWRRRNTGLLGAPLPTRKGSFSVSLAVLVLVFSLCLPMLGASIATVLVLERFVLRRIPFAAQWLGLVPLT